jgi:hypothetical protein
MTNCIHRSPQWLFRVENTYQLHIQVCCDIQRICYSRKSYSILIAQQSLNNTGDQLFMHLSSHITALLLRKCVAHAEYTLLDEHNFSTSKAEWVENFNFLRNASTPPADSTLSQPRKVKCTSSLTDSTVSQTRGPLHENIHSLTYTI